MEEILDPREAPPLRWGFIGAGGIAGTVATALLEGSAQRLHAVAARSLVRAEEFGHALGVDRCYGSYEQLVADPEVDVVYVATVHSTHHAAAKLAVEAGKAVLVEKAFTMDRAQAEDLAAVAAARDVFLMEAMWTRFLPHSVELRNRLAAGVIGEPRFARADFGFRDAYVPSSRFFSRELGGGALLDRGIYPISWVSDLMGPPEAVAARASLAPSGVDAQFTAVLDYPSRPALAQVEAALNVTTPQSALVAGTEGFIRVPPPFWGPSSLEIRADGQEPETWTYPVRSSGYEYEIAEVARRVAAGDTESPVMPVAESVALMGVMDQIRAQVGVTW